MKRLVILILFFAIVFPYKIVLASELDTKIEELQKKIGELQGTENSLAKQINILNSQITLTTLRIDSTKTAILKLSEEARQLADEIERLETLLTRRSALVLKRIPESYKRQVTPQFGLLFFSQDFQDFLSRVKYISSVQEDDARLLFQLKATQNNFSERKKLRDEKKVQQEVLQKQLETENRELDRQKKQKQTLLEQTRSSEAVYQSLLAQSLAEKQALERALVEGVKVGPVKKGDPIALVGNSGYPGCSSGAHLHFEVRQSGAWVNAEQFLSSRSVIDQQAGIVASIGSGSWDWPLDGDVIVTQHFGKTPYSWRYAYSGGIHTGVDMVSNTSSIIKAPKDGVMYSSSQACGSSSIIKIKYIDHGDGLVSFYLHVQ